MCFYSFFLYFFIIIIFIIFIFFLVIFSFLKIAWSLSFTPQRHLCQELLIDILKYKIRNISLHTRPTEVMTSLGEINVYIRLPGLSISSSWKMIDIICATLHVAKGLGKLYLEIFQKFSVECESLVWLVVIFLVYYNYCNNNYYLQSNS